MEKKNCMNDVGAWRHKSKVLFYEFIFCVVVRYSKEFFEFVWRPLITDNKMEWFRLKSWHGLNQKNNQFINDQKWKLIAHM